MSNGNNWIPGLGDHNIMLFCHFLFIICMLSTCNFISYIMTCTSNHQNIIYFILFHCTVIPAPECDPVDVDHASFQGSTFVEGDSIVYRCDKGYMLKDGDLTRRCQSDGTWDGNVPVCKGVYHLPIMI